MVAYRFPLIAVLIIASLLCPSARGDEPTIGTNELKIHDVARMGTREELDQLLKANPAWRDARTLLGSTPLHYAALNLDSGPLKGLLAAGADVHAKDREGMTPLHMAAFATRTENAMLLLQAGADPRARTDAGRDVLSVARKVRADEAAGMISLWILKGCKAGKPCDLLALPAAQPNDAR